MDKTTHELIKMHIKENEGTVYLTAPNFWVEAKPAFWANE